MNGRTHQSKAAFFTPSDYLRWRRSSCPYTNFFENSFSFWVVLSFPQLIDNYAKSAMGRFCISSSPAFLLMAERINLTLRFLLLRIICVGGDLLVHTPIFSKYPLVFGFFLSFPQLIDNYAKSARSRFCISSGTAFLLMAERINLTLRFLLHRIICAGGDRFFKNGTLLISSGTHKNKKQMVKEAM